MNENETFEFEDRTYINPDISRDEQTDFINTLRDIQAQNNAQIATETHNLGTDIESTRGGLTGSEEYWKSLYQTPQTEAAIANMKAVAQQSALNDALSNYSNMLQNRYNQAYRDYQKRAYNYSRKNSGGGGGSGSNPNLTSDQQDGDVEYKTTTQIDVSGGQIKNRDAIQESMIKKEAERLMQTEGLDPNAARAQALKNLGIGTSVLDKIKSAYVLGRDRAIEAKNNK